MTLCDRDGAKDFCIHLSGTLDEDTFSLAMPLSFRHDQYTVCAAQISIPSNFNNISHCCLSVQIDGEPALNLELNTLCQNYQSLAARLNEELATQRCLTYFGGVAQSPISIIVAPANESIRIEARTGDDLPPYQVFLNRRLATKMGLARWADMPMRAPFNVQNDRRTNLAYFAEQIVVKCGLVEPHMYNDEMLKVLAAFKCERSPVDGMRSQCRLDFQCPVLHSYESTLQAPVAAGTYEWVTIELCDTDGYKLIYPRGAQFYAQLHFQRLV